MCKETGSLLAAFCLITSCAATAFSLPNTVLRLVNDPSYTLPVPEEPERPQWPAQYQVTAVVLLCDLYVFAVYKATTAVEVSASSYVFNIHRLLLAQVSWQFRVPYISKLQSTPLT